MPPRISLSLRNSKTSWSSSPARPYQFVFIAISMTGCGTIAGVHSDGVNLGHQRRVDELGLRVTAARRSSRGCSLGEQVADVVVLQREQRVEHREPDPPVVGEPAQVHARSPDRPAAASSPRSSACRPRRCAASPRPSRHRSRRSATRPTSGCSGWRRPAAAWIRRAPVPAPSAGLSCVRVGPVVAGRERDLDAVLDAWSACARTSRAP